MVSVESNLASSLAISSDTAHSALETTAAIAGQRGQHLGAGPQHHQRAEETDDDRAPAANADGFAEPQRGAERHEQAGGEAQRAGFRERHVRQRVVPHRHGEDADEPAQHLQRRARRTPGARRRIVSTIGSVKRMVMLERMKTISTAGSAGLT